MCYLGKSIFTQASSAWDHKSTCVNSKIIHYGCNPTQKEHAWKSTRASVCNFLNSELIFKNVQCWQIYVHVFYFCKMNYYSSCLKNFETTAVRVVEFNSKYCHVNLQTLSVFPVVDIFNTHVLKVMLMEPFTK